MKIDVRFRGLESSNFLREYAIHKVEFALARFKDDVGSAEVRIADVNGPRGGMDKRCQVIVRGPRFRPSKIEELHEDPYAVVDRAMERTARVIGRGLDRGRHYRQQAKRQAVK